MHIAKNPFIHDLYMTCGIGLSTIEGLENGAVTGVLSDVDGGVVGYGSGVPNPFRHRMVFQFMLMLNIFCGYKLLTLEFITVISCACSFLRYTSFKLRLTCWKFLFLFLLLNFSPPSLSCSCPSVYFLKMIPRYVWKTSGRSAARSAIIWNTSSTAACR